MASSGLISRLAEFGTILFGREDDPETKRQKDFLGAANLGEDRIFYVACDRSPEEKQLCDLTGLTKTPMMIVGGVGYEGFQDEAQLTEALDLPARVAKILKARKAVMYGKEDCIWTQRQKVLFGPLFESHVTYVQCDKEAAKCAAAGVHGLPSWDVEVGAEKKRLEGFHFLVALEELAGGKRV